MRNEHDVNLSLVPKARPTWQAPSTCIRPRHVEGSFISRLLRWLGV